MKILTFCSFALIMCSFVFINECYGTPLEDYMKNWNRQHQANNQTIRFYNEQGYNTGRAEQSGSTTRFYDQNGYSTGRAETNYGGYDYYNTQGNRVGYSR